MNKTVSMKESPISTFRAELMGMASIGVLMVHSTAMINTDGLLNKILGRGGIGVYMFVFLSAMGLYYSMKKQPDKKTFYRKRIQRVLIPYLCFALTYYSIKDVMVEHDLIGFLLDVTTLGFWLDSRSVWFIAFLLPIYIIFPCFFHWMENGHRTMKAFSIILIDFVVQGVLLCTFPDTFSYYSQVLQSLWVFALGYHCAKEIHEKGSHCWHYLILFVPMYLLKLYKPLLTIIPLNDMVYAYEGVVFLVLAAEILRYATSIALFRPAINLFKLLGGITLEIYLTNDYVAGASLLFHLENYIPNDIVRYLLIVFVGITVSYLFSTLYKTHFINRIEKSHR